MGSANAVKKLDTEIKRSKEEVENMDLRRVICIATNFRNFRVNTFVAFCSFFPCSLTVVHRGRQQKSGGRQ